MPPLQPFVSNTPLQVAKNLRFNDAAGIPVTQLLPVGMNGNIVNDSPTTGYISCIGASLSNQIDLYNDVVSSLNQYTIDIDALQAAVALLELSGSTIPNVNGYCYSGNALAPITTIVELMANSTCDYNTVLGTTSALTQAILAEGASTLNALPAFSQNSAMSGLAGWFSTPLTIASSFNNLWLAYLDMRTGTTNALAAVTPDCSSVIVDYQPVYGNSQFTIYISGYSFIPTGYTDLGSTVQITDNYKGSYTTSLDIVARSQYNAAALAIPVSGSTLSPTSPFYTVKLTSNITNSSIGVTCVKSVVKETQVPTSLPNIGNFSKVYTSGSTEPPFTLVDGLSYTPKYVDITPKNSYTSNVLKTYGYYITYTANGAVLNFATSPAINGTLDIDYITYK